MNMSEYQTQAWGFTKIDARCPEYMLLGLSGEVGELHSLFAKMIRDDAYDINEIWVHDSKLPDVIKELGDVLWFIAGIASLYGLTLEEVAQANIDKLTSRQARGTIGGSGDNR